MTHTNAIINGKDEITAEAHRIEEIVAIMKHCIPTKSKILKKLTDF